MASADAKMSAFAARSDTPTANASMLVAIACMTTVPTVSTCTASGAAAVDAPASSASPPRRAFTPSRIIEPPMKPRMMKLTMPS